MHGPNKAFHYRTGYRWPGAGKGPDHPTRRKQMTSSCYGMAENYFTRSLRRNQHKDGQSHLEGIPDIQDWI